MALRRGGEANVRVGLGAQAARVVRALRRHRLALFLAALALSALCFQAIPGDTLEGSLVQAAVLAAVTIGAVALGRPAALSLPRVCGAGAARVAARRTEAGNSSNTKSDTGGEQSEDAGRSTHCARGGNDRTRGGDLGRWVVAVLVVGTLAGAASWWMLSDAGMLAGAVVGAAGSAPSGQVSVGSSGVDSVSALVFRLGAVLLLCLFTGIFEEGVFRVLALDALAPAFEGRKRHLGQHGSDTGVPPTLGSFQHGLFGAAVASSVLFGMLHVSTMDGAAAGSAVAWVQFVLKPVQAGLFGFFMAALFVRTGNLWVVAGVHGLFNLLYTGPALLAGSVSTTYVTGNPAELALLIVMTLVLVPPAVVAARIF